jgi:hypothetical protein
MKIKLNIIKTLAISFITGLFALSAFGVSQTFTIPTATTVLTNLVNGATRIKSVTIVNNSVNSNLVWTLFDAPLTNHTGGYHPAGRSNQAAAVLTSAIVSITNTVTNFGGVIFTNIFNNAVQTTTNTSSPSVTAWTVVSQGLTSSNSGTYTITFPGNGYPAIFGISFSVPTAGINTGPTVTVNHDPFL